MENQSWDKAKLEEWTKFWDSEMGKEALNKMNELQKQLLLNAMNQTDTSVISACVGRAAGIDIVIQDIKAGFTALEGLKEKEEKKKK